MGLPADRGQFYILGLGVGFRQFYQVTALEWLDLGLLHVTCIFYSVSVDKREFTYIVDIAAGEQTNDHRITQGNTG